MVNNFNSSHIGPARRITRQIDYDNAFAQAELSETVFVEPPKPFGPKLGKELVLKLLKSLYGLKQAPRTVFEKLKAGPRGSTRSSAGKFLFKRFIEEVFCCVLL